MSRAVIVAAVAAVLSSGCGLIESDITRFNLSTPEREFTVDTGQWGLSDTMAEFPALPCDPAADMCQDAVTAVCSNMDSCLGTCVGDSGTGSCHATVVIALTQSINLRDERPELSTINNQPLVKVTIEKAEYEVNENSLTFATPNLTIYVAPVNVMNPMSPEAKAVGVIPSVPAGRELGWTEVMLTEEGEAALRDFMGDYQSTFNIMIAADVEIAPGDTLPEGRAVARFRVEAYASL